MPPQITAPACLLHLETAQHPPTPDHHNQPGEEAVLQDKHEQGQRAGQHQPKETNVVCVCVC